MKKLALATLLALGAAGIGAPAYAMPVVQAPALDSGIVHVEGGCGPGGHRGPYGRCYPNYVRRPFYRACPPGMHLNPYGHCRPNF
jgi:hypothetical protein